MFRTCSVAVLTAMLVLMAGPAGASWTLIDDFDGYTTGSEIRYAPGWTVTGSNIASQVVAVDPVDAGNRVLAAVSNAANIYTTATIAQGATGTLFFRMYIPDLGGDFSVGMTTEAAPTQAGHHADSFRTAGGELRVHPDATYYAVGSVDAGSWYNVWHVLDNQADTWQAYIEGPGFTGQQQLTSGIISDFPFRYGSGANNLVNFYLRTNNDHSGDTAYIDDIYLHATADLSLPFHLYWAPDTGAGGGGAWNTTDPFWAPDADGSGTKQAWRSGGPYEGAVFGGTAGTVTIGAGGITADRIRFTTHNYTIADGTLTLAGAAPTIVVDTASAERATISARIAGSDGLVKSGTGELRLSGATSNTYGGTTVVTEGTLMLSKTGGAVAVPGELHITSGANVRFSQNNQIADGAHVVMTDSGSVFNGTAVNLGHRNGHSETIRSLTMTGGAFNTGSVGTGSVRSNWTITGAGSFTGGDGNTQVLVHSGSYLSFGSLSLTALTKTTPSSVYSANSFNVFGNTSAFLTTVAVGSGGLTLDGSALLLQKGSGSALGSTLILDGNVTTTGTSASSILLTGSGTVGTCTLQLSSTPGTFTRTFDIGGSGADLLISVDITDGEADEAGIIKTGAGTLTLSGTNTYTGGTEIAQGILEIANGGSLIGGITNNAQLVLNRSDVSTFSNDVSGTGLLRKLGAGTVTLTGTNAYDGGTLVDAGALVIDSTAALPGWDTSGDYTVAAGAILAVTNSVADNDFADMAATGNFAAGSSIGFATTAGNREYSGAVGGDLGLAKLGPNTLTLSGAHTYTGVTTVLAGTLALSGAGVLPATGTVNLSGATASLDISGITAAGASIGSLAGVAGSSVALGAKNINVGGNNTDTSFAGAISGAGGSLTKSGTGTLTLSGTNTYTGGTTVAEGVLSIATTGALPGWNAAGGFSVAGGAVLAVGNSVSDVDFATMRALEGNFAAGASIGFDTSAGGRAFEPVIEGTVGLAKVGPNTLALAGNQSNTYSGLTTVLGGDLMLRKEDGALAVPGDVVIASGGRLRFGQDNQIADNAHVVMSGSGSGLNASGVNSGARTNHTETIGSLTVTGGAFNSGNTGDSSVWTITGDASFTGGPGNTSVTVTTGSTVSFGGLSLTDMTTPRGPAVNGFLIGGNDSARVTSVTVGEVGLTLNNSYIAMRQGDGSTAKGSGLILGGDVATTGSLPSAILKDTTASGTYGQIALELSSTSGNVIRTFDIAGGGADLLVAVDVTNGQATSAGIRKVGLGTLTLGGTTGYSRNYMGTSTYTGATLVEQGTLLVNGSLLGTSGVTLYQGATLGGTGTIASQVAGGGGGAGLISPGNSAGILAVESIDATGGMSFAFEFGQAGSPDYTNATNSVNDVLRLTHADYPLVAALTADNVIDVYLGVNDLEMEDVFRGGVYIDAATEVADRSLFYEMVKEAEYNYFVLGNGDGSHDFGGASYYTLEEYDSFLKMSLSIVGDSAGFVTGDPAILGSIMQFRVIPEPGAALLLAFGLLGFLGLGGRRRRP